MSTERERHGHTEPLSWSPHWATVSSVGNVETIAVCYKMLSPDKSV